MSELKTTYLAGTHRHAGAKMIPFAGYSMPIQYRKGIVGEHEHTRNRAGLFDVSHMGKLVIGGRDGTRAIEKLVGADIQGLGQGRWCYTQILNQEGGVEDDILVGRDPENPDQILHVVVNAARYAHDINLLDEAVSEEVEANLTVEQGFCLLALQGPLAEKSLGFLGENVQDNIKNMGWMQSLYVNFGKGRLFVSRSGYTGNDGFEILVEEPLVDALIERLMETEDVMWCGLGARNTLRLEAGLCLYGNDLDVDTTPIEAGLKWSLSAKRLQNESSYRGMHAIKTQITEGVQKKRVGFVLSHRAIPRDGTLVYDSQGHKVVGKVTSGVFSPTLKKGIGMGYLPAALAVRDTFLLCEIRGEMQQAQVVDLPFVKGLR